MNADVHVCRYRWSDESPRCRTRRNAKDDGWSTCRACRPLSAASSAALGGSAVLLEWSVGPQVLCESCSTATSASPLLAERTSATHSRAGVAQRFTAVALPRSTTSTDGRCRAVLYTVYGNAFIQYNVTIRCAEWHVAEQWLSAATLAIQQLKKVAITSRGNRQTERNRDRDIGFDWFIILTVTEFLQVRSLLMVQFTS